MEAAIVCKSAPAIELQDKNAWLAAVVIRSQNQMIDRPVIGTRKSANSNDRVIIRVVIHPAHGIAKMNC